MSFARTYQYGWRYCQQHTMMRPNQGSSLTSAVASVAVALVIVLAFAAWLAGVEAHWHGTPPTIAGWFSIPAARAAAMPPAPLLIRSQQMPLVLAPGEETVLRLGFKNATGSAWVRNQGSAAILSRADTSAPSAFMASSWIDSLYAAAQEDAVVPNGTIGYLTVRVKAPQQPGTVTERFVLRTLDGTQFADSAIAITVTTTGTGAAPATALASGASVSVYGPGVPVPTGTDGSDANFIPLTPRYTTPPTMRVGLAYHEPEDSAWVPHRVRADVPMHVATENGVAIADVPAGTPVNVDYRPSDGTYHLHIADVWRSVALPVRITPVGNRLLELVSYTKKLHWEGNQADNHFRGAIEIRYVPQTERLWAINELGLEDYLRGLVETSDDAPEEFHKAQVIAARTFALFHIANGGKYTKGQFVLTGTASDQVYRGEDAAARRPNLVAAVEATRGIVMTYDGDVVVTPYFAQSDGHTRAWDQVWGGKPKAWLASVEDPPTCTGKRRIGHGVGMSQRCAMELANQGWNFQSILHHFYSGVELRKLYE